MSRNQVSRFSLAPVVQAPRSTFDLSHDHKTSFNVGDLVVLGKPIQILPGDTFKVKTSKVARMQTLKTPMMQDIILDTYWFFVPNRLVWNHFKEFMGENNESAWIPETTYTVPQIEAPEGGWSVGSIADHMDVPPLVDGLSINALPFRGYALIANEWFRSEVVQDPLVIETGDSTVVGSNGSNYISDTAKGGALFTANRCFDLFSGATLAPQKGEPVSLSILNEQEATLPVYASMSVNDYFAPLDSDFKNRVKAASPLFLANADADVATLNNVKYAYNAGAIFTKPFENLASTTDEVGNPIVRAAGSGNPTFPVTYAKNGNLVNPAPIYGQNVGQTKGILQGASTQIAEYANASAATPINLVANAQGMLQYITVNDLRQAFQIQRFMEREAYSGSRYIEVLRAHFGVTAYDAVLQRPEYLGGSRIPLNIRQITQTSATTDSSPMGDVAGMSVTADSHYDFEKSFTEHGYLFGFVVARYNHVYQQGVPRDYYRKTKYDWFWPEFNSLGNFGIYNGEIYATGTDTDKEIFGYNEAWYDYRHIPSTVSGMMRSVSGSGLDTWHMADYYSELPTLSAGWLKEDKTNVDRVLTVSSAISDQIFIDIHMDIKATRPMTAYSIPGLIDHF